MMAGYDRTTTGAGGPTPALTFRDFDGRDSGARLEFPGLRRGLRSLVAFTDDGSIAGEIRWRKKGGEIALVWVLDELQRRGIATNAAGRGGAAPAGHPSLQPAQRRRPGVDPVPPGPTPLNPRSSFPNDVTSGLDVASRGLPIPEVKTTSGAGEQNDE